MFGLTIVQKSYLEELEEYSDYAERSLGSKERKLTKAYSVMKRIDSDSKRMNKNEIVELCKELLKELK